MSLKAPSLHACEPLTSARLPCSRRAGLPRRAPHGDPGQPRMRLCSPNPSTDRGSGAQDAAVHLTRGWVLEAIEALHARLARCASRAARLLSDNCLSLPVGMWSESRCSAAQQLASTLVVAQVAAVTRRVRERVAARPIAWLLHMRQLRPLDPHQSSSQGSAHTAVAISAWLAMLPANVSLPPTPSHRQLGHRVPPLLDAAQVCTATFAHCRETILRLAMLQAGSRAPGRARPRAGRTAGDGRARGRRRRPGALISAARHAGLLMVDASACHASGARAAARAVAHLAGSPAIKSLSRSRLA